LLSNSIPGNKLQNTKQRVRLLLNEDKIPLIAAAFDATELVGLYSLMWRDPVNLPQFSPWLNSVYVKPKYRGRGIGTQLVHHALELSKQLGVEVLYLETRDRQSLYSRIGFEPLCQGTVLGEAVTVMSRATGK
jgi:GNAT superfamily N-acetyltransferase